jgi:UDP-N-acetylmuramoylalanine--D-glutamate ligase
MVAIRAFTRPEIVILGGRTKGVPFDALAQTVVEHGVKQVIAIGETGPEIVSLLRERGFENITVGSSTIEEIIAQARELAEPGDVVLLSTGCASFDMFPNYKARGEQFSQAVRALAPAAR